MSLRKWSCFIILFLNLIPLCILWLLEFIIMKCFKYDISTMYYIDKYLDGISEKIEEVYKK